REPVWKLVSVSEGLGYVTQEAMLLNCTPAFMLGITWRRVFNPVASKWGSWVCIDGDTGDIKSSTGDLSSQPPENPIKHARSSAYLYNEETPFVIRRTVSTVSLTGACTTTRYSELAASSINSAVDLGWFALAENVASNVPGHDFTVFGSSAYYDTVGIQQASSKDHWYSQIYENRLVAYRYG